MKGTGLCSNVLLYKTLAEEDGYGPDADIYPDRYLSAKMSNNIDISFNVAQTVDDIEQGLYNLSDFSGAKLSLLVDEMKYRNSPATGISSLDLTTRTLYYRKRKMVEYA